MFKNLSKEIVQFLLGIELFTQVMQHNNKMHLFPLVASEINTFPITVYGITDCAVASKDIVASTFFIDVFFSEDQYDECCELVDEIIAKATNVYYLQEATVNFNSELKTYVGSLNFKTL